MGVTISSKAAANAAKKSIYGRGVSLAKQGMSTYHSVQQHKNNGDTVGTALVKIGTKSAASSVAKKSIYSREIALAKQGMSTYRSVQQHKSNGGTVGTALVKTGTKFTTKSVVKTIPSAITNLYEVAPLAIQGIKTVNQFKTRRGQEIRQAKNPTNNISGMFMDTNQAITLRQAAVRQIQGNKLNARSALGGEARIFSPM